MFQLDAHLYIYTSIHLYIDRLTDVFVDLVVLLLLLFYSFFTRKQTTTKKSYLLLTYLSHTLFLNSHTYIIHTSFVSQTYVLDCILYLHQPQQEIRTRFSVDRERERERERERKHEKMLSICHSGYDLFVDNLVDLLFQQFDLQHNIFQKQKTK